MLRNKPRMSPMKAVSSQIFIDEKKETVPSGLVTGMNSEDFCEDSVPDDENLEDERYQVKTKTSKQSPISHASASMNTSNINIGPRTQSSLKNYGFEGQGGSISTPNSFINVMTKKQS